MVPACFNRKFAFQPASSLETPRFNQEVQCFLALDLFKNISIWVNSSILPIWIFTLPCPTGNYGCSVFLLVTHPMNCHKSSSQSLSGTHHWVWPERSHQWHRWASRLDQTSGAQMMPTLPPPKFDSSLLKNDAWKTTSFLLGFNGNFSGANC